VIRTLLAIFFLVSSLSAEVDRSEFDNIFQEVGEHFGVPPLLLKKIAKIESNLNPKCININQNKTIDYGLMQINSCHFKELSGYGINESNVMSPKVNILAGAILVKNLIAKGDIDFNTLGKYHSHTVKFKQVWNGRLRGELAKGI
jgi:soluble lytic murein transglycosylase-like protein